MVEFFLKTSSQLRKRLLVALIIGPALNGICAFGLSFPHTRRLATASTFISRVEIHATGGSSSRRFTTQLGATKKKTKKKRAIASKSDGGGFGATPVKLKAFDGARKKEKDEDYSVFPALDPSVSSTLIPSTMELSEESDTLPNDMYDRLDQIYGFRDFNYGTKASPSPSVSESDKKTPLKNLLLSKPSDFSGVAGLLAKDDGATNERYPCNKRNLDKSNDSDQQDSSVGAALSNLPPFSDFRILHVDPMVLAIDHFFTPEECDSYIGLASGGAGDNKNEEASNDAPLMSRSTTVGKDAQAKSQRTSTTWFHSFQSVPELIAKASRLLGLDDIQHWEEPQTVRYRKTEKFTWHLDALAPNSAKDGAGQRTATLLVYLTDMEEEDGGATTFRDLTAPSGGPLKM
jgi:hypothetical protein